MMRTVNRSLIDQWIDVNGPDGLLRLAQASGVSSSTITKARLGMAPKKFSTRRRLCEAIGVDEGRLFPMRAGVVAS